MEGVTYVSDPATREDLEKASKAIIAKVDAMDRSVNNMRDQNSAEHGSLFSKLLHITELMIWLKAKWERFTRVPDGPPENRK